MQSRTVSFKYASQQMAANGDKIKQWAAESDNLLLKSLAQEVIDIAAQGARYHE